MKLTELELDNLLEAKKTSASAVPAPDAEAVAAAFLVELRRRQANRRRVIYALAASLLLVLSAAVALPGLKSPVAPRTSAVGNELLEAQRLFGDEVAVAFLDGELVTGERLSSDKPNLRLALELVDPATGKRSKLIFAGSDNDTIMLDTPLLAGEIILSRSDRQTTVVEYRLRTGGRLEVRNIALVHHHG